MLEKETFTDPQVVDFLKQNFHAIRLNAEAKGDDEVAKKYNITGYPTVLFLKPDGSEIARFAGHMPAPKFLETTRDFLANKNTLDDYLARLAKEPDNAANHYEAGLIFMERGLVDKGNEHFNQILVSDSTDTTGYVPKVKFKIAEATMRKKEYDNAAVLFNEFITNYPENELLEDAYYYLCRSYNRANKIDDVVNTYRQAIARFPQSADFHNAFAWFLTEQDMNLDEALQVAQKANELSPNDVQILDTLAEVNYKLGNFDKAIEIINSAIKIEADNTYLKEQLDKFQKAKASPPATS